MRRTIPGSSSARLPSHVSYDASAVEAPARAISASTRSDSAGRLRGLRARTCAASCAASACLPSLMSDQPLAIGPASSALMADDGIVGTWAGATAPAANTNPATAPKALVLRIPIILPILNPEITGTFR